MKTKRSSYAHKQDSPGGKKKPAVSPNNPTGSADNEAGKKPQGDCDGICSINWKPVGLAR
jgi:hypothetical protein